MTEVSVPLETRPLETRQWADQMPRVSPSWLALREPADAVARSPELVAEVRRHLRTGRADRAGRTGAGPAVIHDLGCGTGSMGRWLAPQLPGPQHWVMHDRDPELLARAAADMVERATDGSPVTVETREGDVTRLTAADLAGASLVASSALLDLLTADELEHIVVACAGAGCPALFTTSVAGRVELTPADPVDAEIGAAFDAHQRRPVGGRWLLGPDAVPLMADAFQRRGVATVIRSGPWRLTANQSDLLTEWLMGWLGAAYEQRPELADRTTSYARRRLAEAADGRLHAEVHHHDLLAHFA